MKKGIDKMIRKIMKILRKNGVMKEILGKIIKKLQKK